MGFNKGWLVVISFMFLAGCGTYDLHKPNTTDASVPKVDFSLDIVVAKKVAQQPGKMRLVPDKCSPPGTYIYKCKIDWSTCPESIVDTRYTWSSKTYEKSYVCVLFYVGQYSFIFGQPGYCSYYIETYPNGIKQWAECEIYEGGEPYCKFAFSAGFTQPEEWK